MSIICTECEAKDAEIATLSRALGHANERLRAYDAATWREGQPGDVVYCVPVEHEGRIVYDHSDTPIPMADNFKLYTHPAPKADAAAPDGWVCVPREPTEAMQVAGRKKLAEVCDRFDEARNTARSSIEFWQIVGHHPADDIWSTMLAASPARPEGAEK